MGFLVRALRDRASAEDVFQQVFLEAWQRGPAYDPGRASPLTWVMAIARSRAIDQLRKRVPEPRDPAGSLALLEGEGEHGGRRRRAGRALALRRPARPAARRGGRPAAAAVLRRGDADGDRRGHGHPARHREDADGPGARAAARPARRGGARRMNERLSDYLLGELDDAERTAFEAELARDPALAAEVERLRPIVSRLESLDAAAWDPPEAPALATLPRRAARPPAPARDRRRGGAARSCCARSPRARWRCVLLALGVGAGLLLRRRRRRRGERAASSRSTPSSRSAAPRAAPRRSRRRTAARTSRSAA